jgi:hypothetical protein
MSVKRRKNRRRPHGSNSQENWRFEAAVVSGVVTWTITHDADLTVGVASLVLALLSPSP